MGLPSEGKLEAKTSFLTELPVSVFVPFCTGTSAVTDDRKQLDI